MITYETIPQEISTVFVFGANTEGIHGKGSALEARKKYGARIGVCNGMTGNSYAICTKNLKSTTHPSVPKKEIISQIRIMYSYAIRHPYLKFYVSYSDKPNLNGYTPEEMAEMFYDATEPLRPRETPNNVLFLRPFAELIMKHYK